MLRPTIVVVGYAVEILQPAPACCCRAPTIEQALAGARCAGAMRAVPERQHARHGVLQAFRERHLAVFQRRIARVAAFGLMARVACGERRRRHVVAAAPGQHLRVAELLRAVSALVQSLQRAVMALVQAPVVLTTGSHVRSIWSSACQSVHDRPLEHRSPGDDRKRSLRLSAAARPAARLLRRRAASSSTSVQPVKRLSRFQVDSP